MTGRHLRIEVTPNPVLKQSAKGIAAATVAGAFVGIAAPAAFANPAREDVTESVTKAVAATVQMVDTKPAYDIPNVELQVADTVVAGTDWSLEQIDLEAKKPAPKPRPIVQRRVSSASAKNYEAVAKNIPAASSRGGQVVAYARQFIGARYVYGGTTPAGWDCSGFTRYIYSHFGLSLSHSAGAQAARGVRVSASQAQPGDLVFYPGHIGIYAGNGRIVHASTPARGTLEERVWGSPAYYRILP